MYFKSSNFLLSLFILFHSSCSWKESIKLNQLNGDINLSQVLTGTDDEDETLPAPIEYSPLLITEQGRHSTHENDLISRMHPMFKTAHHVQHKDLDLKFGRDLHESVVLEDGSIFVIGGRKYDQSGNFVLTKDMEEIKIPDFQTTDVGLDFANPGTLDRPRVIDHSNTLSLARSRIGHKALRIESSNRKNNIFIIGGDFQTIDQDNNYSFEFITPTGKQEFLFTHEGLLFPEVLLLKDGYTVIVAGGIKVESKTINNVIYKIDTSQALPSVQAIGTLSTGRVFFEMVSFRDSLGIEKIFIAGGATDLNSTSSVTNKTEIFDPVSGLTSSGPDLVSAFAAGTSAYYEDKIILAGGAASFNSSHLQNFSVSNVHQFEVNAFYQNYQTYDIQTNTISEEVVGDIRTFMTKSVLTRDHDLIMTSAPPGTVSENHIYVLSRYGSDSIMPGLLRNNANQKFEVFKFDTPLFNHSLVQSKDYIVTIGGQTIDEALSSKVMIDQVALARSLGGVGARLYDITNKSTYHSFISEFVYAASKSKKPMYSYSNYDETMKEEVFLKGVLGENHIFRPENGFYTNDNSLFDTKNVVLSFLSTGALVEDTHYSMMLKLKNSSLDIQANHLASSFENQFTGLTCSGCVFNRDSSNIFSYGNHILIAGGVTSSYTNYDHDILLTFNLNPATGKLDTPPLVQKISLSNLTHRRLAPLIIHMPVYEDNDPGPFVTELKLVEHRLFIIGGTMLDYAQSISATDPFSLSSAILMFDGSQYVSTGVSLPRSPYARTGGGAGMLSATLVQPQTVAEDNSIIGGDIFFSLNNYTLGGEIYQLSYTPSGPSAYTLKSFVVAPDYYKFGAGILPFPAKDPDFIHLVGGEDSSQIVLVKEPFSGTEEFIKQDSALPFSVSFLENHLFDPIRPALFALGSGEGGQMTEIYIPSPSLIPASNASVEVSTQLYCSGAKQLPLLLNPDSYKLELVQNEAGVTLVDNKLTYQFSGSESSKDIQVKCQALDINGEILAEVIQTITFENL